MSAPAARAQAQKQATEGPKRTDSTANSAAVSSCEQSRASSHFSGCCADLPKRKPLPKFRTEAKERQFWESKDNDVTEYFDPSKMVLAKFKNLKPSTTSISLRLTDSVLDGIRQQANKLDVPYQSLMKVWLTEKLREQNG